VVIPSPQSVFIHRAFDGGVQFSTSTASHNQIAVRQTRRYFRYQSGKGIQISTGTIMKPNFNVDEISNGGSGTTVTVTCKIAHFVQPGATITVSGATPAAYNGTFAIDTIIDDRRFTYIATSAPASAPATGLVNVSVTAWNGAAKLRLGLYDAQNGVFFEFDGTTLWAVRRKSTDQLAGVVNLTNGNAFVTGASLFGTTTKFAKQLTPGDFIVIRGMSYRVLDILSDTSMTIAPPYRGPSILAQHGVTISKTVDTKTPQNQWNIDKCDGTGPSGVTLDLSKMQMFYMDYSWYGAGTIRYGFRNTKGDVFYAHRTVNVNQNTEAYMRSGNLPGRYEINTYANVTQLTANMLVGDTTMTVTNTDGFANIGTLLIANPLTPAQGGAYEYVNYTGKTTTTFTGLTRGKANVSTGISFALTPNVANITTSGSVSGIQAGMYLYYNQGNVTIPNGVYVANVYTGSPNTVTLSQAPYQGNAAATIYFMAMGNVAQAHNQTPTLPIPVYQHAPTVAPIVSHWGTSVIMDGGFDNDKSLQFIYGETAITTLPAAPNAFASANVTPLLSLRVSPATDSGIPGLLGSREIVNRMQLTMQGIDVLTNGSFLVTLVLNGNVSANTGSLGSWQRVTAGTSSLAQIADHTGNCQINGGENMFGFYAVNSAGSTNYSVISQDLTKIRDLGTSILSGGYTAAVGFNVYPDGPDLVTICAQNIGLTIANIQTRLSWTEAQA
jgi:hypothetical protein